jgi:hypothetical protein
MATNQYIRYPNSMGGSGSGVTSLNGLMGIIDLIAGTGISITQIGNDLRISNTTNVTNSFTIMQPDSGTDPTATSPNDTLTFHNSDGNISISGDATSKTLTFNLTNPTPGTVASVAQTTNSVSGLTVSGSPITTSGTLALTLAQATTSTNGYLSSTDWNTFNNKQSSGTYVTSVTASTPLSSSGGTTPDISIDPSAIFNYVASNTSVYGGTYTAPPITGVRNVAIGVGAASGVAVGSDNVLIGYNAGPQDVSYSIGIGSNVTPMGSQSICIGSLSQAFVGIAIGLESTSTGISGIAIGTSSTSTGLSAVALGDSSIASGVNSVAIGTNATVSTDNTIQLGSTGTVAVSTTGSFNTSYTQSTVSGSASGNAIFSQPFQGLSYKKIVVYCNSLLGTASYSFPTPFTNIPAIITTNQVSSSVVTTLSTSTITITGVTTTGYILIEGT